MSVLPDPGPILFCIYLVVGPGAWLAMFVLLLLGRRRMTRLLRTRATLPPSPSHVTVLVPAKDEAAGIRKCIERILAQDYPNFSVVAVDDRSTDGTGAILDELAREHAGRVSALHILKDGLPDGWLGKCHALHVASRAIDTEWLFFVDSDVTLVPHALSRALALSIARKYDALSVLTRLECDGFWDRLILPLAACAWSVMHAISLTNDDTRPKSAAANGQFFLIRRSAYETVGGHETVRAQITEDVELMRHLKGRGFRTRFLLGAHLASTRMHSTLRQMFHGWARIYSGTSRRSPWRIVGAMAFLLLCGFTLYPALAWGVVRSVTLREFDWLIASGAHLLVMSGYLALIYHWSGNRARDALLFPISGSILVAILAFALRTCRTGRVNWRETHFQIPVHAPIESELNHEGTKTRSDVHASQSSS
jgi:cellulose synthase/poly-beta-1,6-N-acetylglucosamine synthase-like glycosyltransferase